MTSQNTNFTKELESMIKNSENTDSAKKSLLNKNIDLFAEDIRLATREISKITGKNDIEDILEIIFNDFCIGK